MTPPALAQLQPGDRLRVVCWWKRGPADETDVEFVALHGTELEVRDPATKIVHYVAEIAVVSVNGKLVGAQW